nr:MAG TPA: hypothetical protein [Herelleviridae sp.]
MDLETFFNINLLFNCVQYYNKISVKLVLDKMQ